MSREKLRAPATTRIIMYKPDLSLGLRSAVYGGHMAGLVRLRGRREMLTAVTRCRAVVVIYRVIGSSHRLVTIRHRL